MKRLAEEDASLLKRVENAALKYFREVMFEAIKTDEGKQKVIDLIDDYENKNLHLKQESGSGNMQKFFDADEPRKRLGL